MDSNNETSTNNNNKPIKVVIISDTHGKHWQLDENIPHGDILIHAGDFTTNYSIEDALDFNEWLGTLPHQYKIVVSGNHDSPLCVRAPRSHRTPWNNLNQTFSIFTNCTFLCDSSIRLDVPGKGKVNVYGTDFYYPMD